MSDRPAEAVAPMFAPSFLGEWARVFAVEKAAVDYSRGVLAPLADVIAGLGVSPSVLHHHHCRCRCIMTPEFEAAADREEAAAKAEAARPLAELIDDHAAKRAAVDAAQNALRSAEVAEADAEARLRKRLNLDEYGGRRPGSPVPTVVKDGRLHVVGVIPCDHYHRRSKVVLTPIDILS